MAALLVIADLARPGVEMALKVLGILDPGPWFVAVFPISIVYSFVRSWLARGRKQGIDSPPKVKQEKDGAAIEQEVMQFRVG